MDVIGLLGVAATLIGMGVGAVVWLVRLEGRINVLASRQDGTDKRVDGLEERISAQLDRIESRLDKILSSQ